jgi:hypothetical protein
MAAKPKPAGIPPPAELREIFQTVSGGAPAADLFATRLQYVADLIAALGPLPQEPVLAWREAGNSARHARIGRKLVVGRQTGDSGLSLAGDDQLSRRHFALRTQGANCALQDLDSRNGTAINASENRIRKHSLCDGDLIYAGRHIFVYLNPARVTSDLAVVGPAP